MKVVILAGGLGTRLAEETETIPKPMVEIGGRPILWHIMQCYAHYGFNEFFIALGYKGEIIKRFFLDYHALNGSIGIDLSSGKLNVYQRESEEWKVNLIDTGASTNTGGRVKRLQRWLGDELFMLTYGDGVCDVNLANLLDFHRAHGRIATVTAVRPPARFGGLVFDGDFVSQFTEKPQIGEGWINGGFLVFEPRLSITWKVTIAVSKRTCSNVWLPIVSLSYRHDRFWQCWIRRDKRLLQGLWQEGRAPWKMWQ
jgi:glucose-1-phosphate cytidylyltransferase